jgi:hypothetical protein
VAVEGAQQERNGDGSGIDHFIFQSVHLPYVHDLVLFHDTSDRVS